MEQEAIVKKLLSKGVMVSPGTLKRMDIKCLDSFLKKAESSKCAVVDNSKEGRLKCSVSMPEDRAEVTAGQVVADNMERFERIRKLILRKVDAVSISNIGRNSSKLVVVGMVKEKTKSGFVLEDGTGEVEVKAADAVELDDVVGVRGWMRDSLLFAEEIVLPDVPMSREPGSMGGSLLLSCSKDAPIGKPDVVLTPCSLTSEEGEKPLPNPAWVYLEKGSERVTVLVYREDGATKDDAVSWLRKRCIGKSAITASMKGMVIEEIPDIMWIVSPGQPWTANYKGITLVSFGEGHQSLVDLKERKIEIS